MKSLEKYLSTVVSEEEARRIMGPLFGAYELRIADAHYSSKNVEDAFKILDIDTKMSRLDQGYRLIEKVAHTILRIGDAIVIEAYRERAGIGSKTSS